MADPVRIWCDACRTYHTDTTPWAMQPTLWVPGCTGKKRHPDAAAAVTSAKYQDKGLSPYPCKHCGGWHLSRTRPGVFAAEQVERVAADV